MQQKMENKKNEHEGRKHKNSTNVLVKTINPMT